MFKSRERREAERQLKIQQEKENILAEQQRRQECRTQQQERAQALLRSIGLWYGNLSRRSQVLVAVGGIILIFALGRTGSTPNTVTTAPDEPATTSSEVASAPVAEELSSTQPAPIAAIVTKTGEDFQYTAPGNVSFESGAIVVSYHRAEYCENTGGTFEQEWETTFSLASRTWTDRVRELSNCFGEGNRDWIPYFDDAQPFEISESEGQTTIRGDVVEADGTLVGDNALVVTYRQGIAQAPVDELETATESAPQSPERGESSATETNNEQPASTMAEPAIGQIGRLAASSPNARINLRDQPSAYTPTQRYGLEGDRVVLQDTTSSEDGYTWYKVQFQGSGAIGWVRGDFVEF